MKSSDMIPPNGVRGILAEIFRDMEEDEREFLVSVAEETKALLREGRAREAWAKCTDNLDNDERLAMWSLFDSKERTALNKGKP